MRRRIAGDTTRAYRFGKRSAGVDLGDFDGVQGVLVGARLPITFTCVHAWWRGSVAGCLSAGTLRALDQARRRRCGDGARGFASRPRRS